MPIVQTIRPLAIIDGLNSRGDIISILKSLRQKLGGKSTILYEDDLQGYNAPENSNNLLEKARSLYLESDSFSISILQERFNISFQAAAKVMDTLEEEGIFGDEDDEDGEWEGYL